jgi:FkbM family methyltransferase
VDIGANIGATARIFGRTAKEIHAFEPSPRALRFLRANAGLATTVYPVALSDKEGTAHFAEREWLDYSSFADEGIEVPVRTLDSFNLNPDLIKIDVEGFEPEVLRGARETLKHRPFVFFEAQTDSALQQCRAELPGYSIEEVSHPNYLATPTDGHVIGRGKAS